MKRFMLFMAVIACTMTVCSQTEHLKFMGFPLDGTIDSFQSKLATKEVKPNTELNKVIGVGTRAFDGSFAGYESEIYVYYEKRTKTVYRAKACIINTDKGLFEQTYNELKKMLIEKYGETYRTGESEGHESVSFLNDEGLISLYANQYKETYPYKHIIHVDYYDAVNYAKNKESVMDDL